MYQVIAKRSNSDRWEIVSNHRKWDQAIKAMKRAVNTLGYITAEVVSPN